MSISDFIRRVDLGPINALALLSCVASLFTANPLETAWATGTLYVTIKLLWWQRVPAVFLVVAVLPWLEVHTNVFEANFHGIGLNGLYASGTGKKTFWLASCGYLAVISGFYLGIRKRISDLNSNLVFFEDTIHQLNQLRILAFIILFQIIEGLVGNLFGWGSALRQIETYLAGIRIALMLVFFVHFFVTKQRRWLVWSFFLFELVISFYSYFGTWKLLLILFMLGAIAQVRRIRLKEMLLYLPLFFGIFFLTFLWQSIKMDYRMILSNHERIQAVKISKTEALNSFVDLSQRALDFSKEEQQTVVNETLRRVGYLEYYSGVVKNVPEKIDHLNGALLRESLTFALIPRILNPDKGIKNDVAKVERFTDHRFGRHTYASFSLGHYCEAYIDWGPVGSLVHLFCYGLLGAWITRITIRRAQKMQPLMVWGLLFVTLRPWGTMQQDAVSVFGQLFWNGICQLILFLPVYLWISKAITPNKG